MTSAIVRPPPRGTLVPLDRRSDPLAIPEGLELRRIGVDPDERVARLGHRRRLGFVGGRIDLRGDTLVWVKDGTQQSTPLP